MRRLSFISILSAVTTLSLLAATCGEPRSQLPTSPAAPAPASVEISGPSTVAPGQSAQFAAVIRLTDGTTKTATPGTNVVWRTSSSSVLTVNSTGLATAPLATGETTLSAEVATPTRGVFRRSTKEVVVVPDGTYRVVGLVSEIDSPTAPVAGARVEVTPGNLVATTGFDGRYRLYGVPADAQIRITQNGYQPIVQGLHLTGHATQNFQLPLSGPRLNLAGPYMLALDVVGACSGSPGLSQELQHRRYDAVVTQDGLTLDVTLTEPRFRTNGLGRGNRFAGRAGAAGATFTLEPYHWYYYGYGYYGPTAYPSIAERLPNGSFFVVEGTAVTTGSAAGLSGQLSGVFAVWDPRFPTVSSYLGGCASTALQFTLSPR